MSSDFPGPPPLCSVDPAASVRTVALHRGMQIYTNYTVASSFMLATQFGQQ